MSKPAEITTIRQTPGRADARLHRSQRRRIQFPTTPTYKEVVMTKQGTKDSDLHDETSDKLAVVEALYRFAAGIDLRDKDLLASSLADNAVSDVRLAAAKAGFEYPVLEGKETIVAALLNSLSQLVTTHSVSNPRVSVDGDSARLEALVEAQHLPREDHSRHYLMKNRYDVELVRQGKVWLIRRTTVDNFWRTGDPAVLSGV
jgi:septum formation inhibitor-activating ATPase MinD